MRVRRRQECLTVMPSRLRLQASAAFSSLIQAEREKETRVIQKSSYSTLAAPFDCLRSSRLYLMRHPVRALPVNGTELTLPVRRYIAAIVNMSLQGDEWAAVQQLRWPAGLIRELPITRYNVLRLRLSGIPIDPTLTAGRILLPLGVIYGIIAALNER